VCEEERERESVCVWVKELDGDGRGHTPTMEQHQMGKIYHAIKL